jgi:hypothetical protein
MCASIDAEAGAIPISKTKHGNDHIHEESSDSSKTVIVHRDNPTNLWSRNGLLILCDGDR